MLNDLRCEYLTDPLGVGETVPRLSWTIVSPLRTWRQSAYQVQVATSRDKLLIGRPDLWDSGKIPSASTSQIIYDGNKLTSRQQCCWQARAWDSEDSPTLWSGTAYWEMALLADSDWDGAKWIGSADGNTEPAPFFRKEFDISSVVKQARIYACGLGYADISLNGARIGGNIERETAYTDFDKRVLYSSYDITKFIYSGKNALGAILGCGWYDVFDLAVWNFDTAPWKGARRLILKLVVDFVDGTSQTLISDDTWKSATGPILRDGIYSGEIYDARLEMPGWNKTGFDDTAWPNAAVLPSPKGKLEPCPCPPVVISNTFKAVRITEPTSGTYVVDFGQNLSGHAQLNLTAPAGTAVTLRYGERVGEDGNLLLTGIDHLMLKSTPPQLFQTDTYICKGSLESEIWEQRFSYSGFRYAEVTGLNSRPTVANFSSRFAHTDLKSAGSFACSDPMLNKIQDATLYSYLSNAQSIPTDCPQREKNGWTGDAHLAAEAGLMNFHSATFYTKWLNDVADNQVADGQIGVVIPTGGWGMGNCDPAWDSTYAIIAWDMYRYLGDERILERHFGNISRYVDHLSSKTEDGVVAFDSLGDWLPWKTETPSQFSSTICLYVDAQILAKAAVVLGKDDAAIKYSELADATKTAFNKKWLDTASGTYLPEPPANGGQTAQSLPLFFGLVPDDMKDSVFAALANNVQTLGHIDTGILGAKAILRILSEMGRTDLAYRIVTNKNQPSWAWWMEQGLTTLSESWTNQDSLNHIMFGDVSNWMYQWIAGIGLDENAPGFKNVLIRPQPIQEIAWVEAYHDSPHGRIFVDWKKLNGEFYLNIDIPANSSATVFVPASSSEKVSEGGRPIDQNREISLLRHDGGISVYAIGSGRYRFRSS